MMTSDDSVPASASAKVSRQRRPRGDRAPRARRSRSRATAAACFDRDAPPPRRQDGASTASRRAPASAPTRARALAEPARAGGRASRSRSSDGAPPSRGDHDGRRVLRAPPPLRRHWLHAVYEHPLWEKITDGQASRAQVHRLRLREVPLHRGRLRAHGRRRRQRHAGDDAPPRAALHRGVHPRRHLPEGPPEPLPRRSDPPLAAAPDDARALNFLSETAARSSFAYYAGNEVLQMTENTGDAGDGARGRRRSTRRCAATTRGPTSSSTRSSPTPTPTRSSATRTSSPRCARACRRSPGARSATRSTSPRSMAEHLLLFMDGIDLFYGGLSDVPRPPAISCPSRRPEPRRRRTTVDAHALGYDADDRRRLARIARDRAAAAPTSARVIDSLRLPRRVADGLPRSARCARRCTATRITCIDAAILAYGLLELLLRRGEARASSPSTGATRAARSAATASTLYWAADGRVGALQQVELRRPRPPRRPVFADELPSPPATPRLPRDGVQAALLRRHHARGGRRRSRLALLRWTTSTSLSRHPGDATSTRFMLARSTRARGSIDALATPAARRPRPLARLRRIGRAPRDRRAAPHLLSRPRALVGA